MQGFLVHQSPALSFSGGKPSGKENARGYRKHGTGECDEGCRS